MAFDVLKNELVWLYHRWATYKQLFGRSKHRIELLNAIASGFFFVVQESLYDDVVLSICRICDPPQTGRGKKAQANMTIRRLLQEVGKAGDAELMNKLNAELADIEAALPPLLEYRHKHVGHRDFEVAVKKVSLSGPSREQVDTMLDLIAKLLNKICNFYGDTEWLFDALAVDGDAEQLLNTAKAGLRYFVLFNKEVISLPSSGSLRSSLRSIFAFALLERFSASKNASRLIP